METLTWIIGILSVSLGILSVVLAIVLTSITNKTIKSEDARTKELIEKMEKGVRETLERMDKRGARSDEILRHIADLIAAEGEKTRELIKRGRP